MVSYDIWFDLQKSSDDLKFCEVLEQYMGMLKDRGMLQDYRLRRRMLGLGPHELGEFNVTLEFTGLPQLDQAFQLAATRGPDIEPVHAAVYSRVKNLRFGLSRDFPDPVRVVSEAGIVEA